MPQCPVSPSSQEQQGLFIKLPSPPLISNPSIPVSNNFIKPFKSSLHTNSFLDEATSDIPRLHTALTSKRHYDVVTEAQVNEAKKQIEDEIRPHLNELMRRGEEGVEKEEANARRARNKVRGHCYCERDRSRHCHQLI